MSEQRQISDSSNTDKEAENMDKISTSPAYSATSVAAEITTDFDELMQCDDLLDDEEVNCLCSEERYSSSWCSLSQESRTTCSSCWGSISEDGRVADATSWRPMNRDGWLTDCSSWCSSSDSDISEVITSFDQNLNEEITKICQSFFNPENLETEADDCGDKDEVGTPEPESSSRLGIRSEESTRPASCTSSSSTNTAITEAAKMLVSCVIDEAVEILQSTEAVKTLVATEPMKTCQDAPPRSDTSSSPVVEEQDVNPEETGNIPSPPSTSSFQPAHQVDMIPQSQGQPQTRTATDFQEETRNSPSHPSREPRDGDLKAVPPGPSEEDGDITFSQKAKEAAADWQLVLNSSSITTLIRTFFQGLSEEQWREVSEGVYNQDVKEQLTDMCTDVLRFISESVAKSILKATSGILTLSSAPLTEYFGITEYNMQRSLESSFLQALCDVVGADNPGRISPKFIEAIAGEVTDKVNSVLSVAMQASLDGGSSSVTAAASCSVSKDRAEKKALEGAIATMRSFLTGRGTAVKRRIQRDKVLTDDSEEEKFAGGCKGKRKKSEWKRCFSGWQREKIHPVPLNPLGEPVRPATTDLTFRNTGESKQGSCCSQETPSTTSSSISVGADLRSTQLSDYVEDEDETSQDSDDQVTCSKFLEDPTMAQATADEFKEEMNTCLTHQSISSGEKDEGTFCQSSVDQSQPYSERPSNKLVDVEKNTAKKSNRFSRFFRNVFSKKNEKTKRPPFWMRLLDCSACSCCPDK